MDANKFPDTTKEVILDPYQFSVWNPETINTPKDTNYRQTKSVTRDNEVFDNCWRIAEQCADGRIDDLTGGAIYYHADYVDPAWSDRLKTRGYNYVRIDNHIFYRPTATI